MFSNHDFGVIYLPFRGKGLCGTNGNLWYKDTPCQYKERDSLLCPIK
ncbi:hypothetical protein HMPREF9420_2781 [Segatella salivae DSM 15606]|uniref:Uncharacterized protein n=1 Tax=Segatella salivae DSM 15606 TaxID=888832 RepID=E6MTG3_9BACT|nr:hypothetical protein HMPREF9420_2781 [Segatella salivae DSM 15606]